MKKYFKPHSEDMLVAEVPDDIGPEIAVYEDGPNGTTVESIDYVNGVYRCSDGTEYQLPEKISAVERREGGWVVEERTRHGRLVGTYPLRCCVECW